MSHFSTRHVACPRCKVVAPRSLVDSLNCERTPAARDAILSETFQQFSCESCNYQFLVEDPFIYTDFIRKHWIGVFPRSWELQWAEYETHPVKAYFDNMEGPHSSPAARVMAGGFKVRAVFGLPTLREKLICFDQGLDDAQLELVKLHLMRTVEGLTFGPQSRPRLHRVEGSELIFRVPCRVNSQWRVVELGLPLELYHRQLDDAPSLVPFLRSLRAGAFVDLGRIMIEPTSQE